ncbi:MAG: hypothetical protein MI784_12510, partial [Cytophagales bacterium]|nr:hypothetical protein [Cytophagales bacterium]
MATLHFSAAQETQALKPGKGKGTEKEPLLIESLAHLRWLSEGKQGGLGDSERWSLFYQFDVYYIDAKETKSWNRGKGFRPIGNPGTPFLGQLDGQGAFIKNLFINRPDESCIGFFGNLSGNKTAGKVVKLEILNADITGGEEVGALAGRTNQATIKECLTTGIVKGKYIAGGLVGKNGEQSTISHSASFSKVSIIGSKDYAGGLVGLNEGSLSISYAIGKVSAATSKKGGLVGGHSGDAKQIVNCYWDKETTGLAVSSGSAPEFGVASEKFGKLNNLNDWFKEVEIWDIKKHSSLDPSPRPYAYSWRLYVIQEHEIKVAGKPSIALQGAKGTGKREEGEKVVLQATPQPGYVFSRWEANGKEVSRENPYVFTVDRNLPKEYTAVFAESYEFAGGKGTEKEPYQIATLEQLAYLSYVPSLWTNQYFVLNNDIDASATKNWNNGKGFLPIATGGIFKSSLDGRYHTISGLTMDRKFKVGVFSVLAGTVSNIAFTKVNYHSVFNGNVKAGAVCAESYEGRLKQVFAEGKIHVESSIVRKEMHIGGFVGEVDLEKSINIKDCMSLVDIQTDFYFNGDRSLSTELYLGGMVGSTWGANEVERSYADGKITINYRKKPYKISVGNFAGHCSSEDRERFFYNYWN